MIEKHEKYLEKIGGYLQKFFAQQEPYIFCKQGCAICCETGQYPFSEIEFQYAMLGYNDLSEEEKSIVQSKIQEIKTAKENSTDEKFLYECPFLINKRCSIYKHRGIICRSYGLAYFVEDENEKLSYKMPCCVNNELNYSNVYDEETGTFSSKRWKETGIEQEPLSYNIGLKFLLNNNMTKELGLEFGEEKALIDWFI